MLAVVPEDPDGLVQDPRLVFPRCLPVDGIIKEDRLGLAAIYIQAKRWDPKHRVSRPDVQAFAGGLEAARARKGVFITTSRFSGEAHDYVSRIEKNIVLIAGPHLAALMFDHGVGVRTKKVYEWKSTRSTSSMTEN